uniref:RING-type domain-containing protein n=1 Tax=Sphaeramia orbicularis TaxID=375764 RepID=A0A672Y4W6_9TELE
MLDPASCSLCQEVLGGPVCSSCGHWFCRQCITSYWDQFSSSGDSSCPQTSSKPYVTNRSPSECVKLGRGVGLLGLTWA